MRKVLFVLMLCLLLVGCVGCKKEKVSPSYITAENIYNLSEDKYLIYFEKENCSQCAETLPYVIEYLTDTSGNNKYPIVYRVLLEFIDDNGDTVTLPISRAMEGNTGQGPNGNFYVNGVSNWIALYIAATPSLIEVSVVDGVKQSQLVAVGTTEIKDYLNNLKDGK